MLESARKETFSAEKKRRTEIRVMPIEERIDHTPSWIRNNEKNIMNLIYEYLPDNNRYGMRSEEGHYVIPRDMCYMCRDLVWSDQQRCMDVTGYWHVKCPFRQGGLCSEVRKRDELLRKRKIAWNRFSGGFVPNKHL